MADKPRLGYKAAISAKHKPSKMIINAPSDHEIREAGPATAAAR